MKRELKSWCYAAIFLACSPVFTESTKVTVLCSNGSPIPFLEIIVQDANQELIPSSATTDEEGMLELRNVESYQEPFVLSFITLDGNRSSDNRIAFIQKNEGIVVINYYPTNSPSSCAQFFK